MGQPLSKDELLYQQVNYGNVEGIKSLHREGASLEWIDREGKTPLILACMNPLLYNVAETLIELGANVNAYRPGRHAGCPLHQAAKRGLDRIVKLLLAHGANALRMNDDGQTPLDIARAKRYTNVVRTIESHISLFSGWLRQFYGLRFLEVLAPRFLEAVAPQLLSRKIWVVVMPVATSKPKMPSKLVIAMYSSQQDAQPFSIIQLWRAKIEEPTFHQPDPAVIIFNKANKTQFRLASENEGNKQQLQWFCNACRGIPQARQSSLHPDTYAPVVAVSGAPSSTAEDLELAMAINASIQSALQEGVPILPDDHLSSEVSHMNGWGSANYHQGNGISPMIRPVPPPGASSSDWLDEPSEGSYNGWGTSETESCGNQSQHNISMTTSNGLENSKNNPNQDVCVTVGGSVPPSGASSSGWLDKPTEDAHHRWGAAEARTSSNLSQHSVTTVQVADKIPEAASVPSAPPISEHADEEPVQYPSIDTSPVDLSIPSLENKPEKTSQVKQDGDDSSSCVICLDAPIEGACIPCGHMAGCMSCLNEIKTKKWGCPVCRANIIQVLKIYSV